MTNYETTTGHGFSTAEWLNMHFEAARPEYEAMLRSVGIQAGWHVLDAGCGNGRYVDLIDTLVGPIGQISTIDLAPENINAVKQRISSMPYSSEVTTHVGSVTALPFPDDTFDAIWCSAVTQYLTEEELKQTLKEFRRAVKPGGIVAIKEYDGSALYFHPMPELTLLWRSIEMMNAFDLQRWFVHPLEMQSLLENAGIKNVHQQTTLVERRQPLNEAEIRYIQELIRGQQIAWSSLESLSMADQEKWETILSETSPQYLLTQPNFYWREGHIVTKGIA